MLSMSTYKDAKVTHSCSGLSWQPRAKGKTSEDHFIITDRDTDCSGNMLLCRLFFFFCSQILKRSTLKYSLRDIDKYIGQSSRH
jgi:hypothetical protein